MALDSLNCRNGHTALVPQELSCASSPECSLCIHFPFFLWGSGGDGGVPLCKEGNYWPSACQTGCCMNIYAWSFRSAHAFPYFVYKTV